MIMRKRPHEVRTKTSEGPGRKSLPLLTFEEYATTLLQALFARLPIAFTHKDLIREIHTYLDYSVKEIRLRGKFRMRVKAIDFPRYPNPPHWGENNEILEQTDFKDAELLYTDENLTSLEKPMQLLRKKSGELSIGWDRAVSVVRRVVDKFGLEGRTLGVRRGEFGVQIIQELTRILEDKRKFRTFDELERDYSYFQVVQIFRSKPFDEEDRDLLIQPNRWGRLETYAAGILQRYFNKKPDTIKKDRKQFNPWARHHASEKH
jgi:hypothetical protein